MSSELSAALVRLARAYRLLVALDFDGTISAIVADPASARPVPGALEQLHRLSLARGVDVLLLSGRGRDDLAAVSGAAEIATLVGSHGQEMGAGIVLADDERALIDRLAADVRVAVAPLPEARVEDKPAGFAVHVRGCTPQDADLAVARVEALVADALHRMHGKMVVEFSVRPLDKGSALRSLIDDDPDRLVLFAGDDVTDESAMAVLRDQDVAVKVGTGQTRAGHRVDSPEAMVAVLTDLADLRAG